MIKKDLEKLNTSDIYSILLFALAKFKDVPEYSTLSQLVYVLDKSSLLNLCQYFGGLTITIPTIRDMQTLVYALLVYNDVNLEHKSLEQVLKNIDMKSHNIKEIRKAYYKLKDLLKDYDIQK